MCDCQIRNHPAAMCGSSICANLGCHHTALARVEREIRRSVKSQIDLFNQNIVIEEERQESDEDLVYLSVTFLQLDRARVDQMIAFALDLDQTVTIHIDPSVITEVEFLEGGND